MLRQFRAHCDILISIGNCAIAGGIPALRNNIPLKECLDEAYLNGPTVYNPEKRIPNDPEIPLLLNKVLPGERGGEDRLPPPRLPAAGGHAVAGARRAADE